MYRILALLIVLASTYLVRQVGASDPLELHSAALALGFALIAAGLAGSLVVPLGLPRVTGYLLFGLFCGPYVANLISGSMARELRVLNDLAVVLIAFMAGLEMNVAHLRPRLGSMLRVGLATIGATNLGFFLLFWLAWPWLPIAPEVTGLARMSLVVLLGSVASCSSPSVAMAIIAETRSKGRLSELVIAVVILADLVLIVLFTLAMQFVRFSLGGSGEAEVGLLARLVWQIVGSIAFGGAVGALFALYTRLVGRELTIILLTLCVAISTFGERWHFEPVLASLAAGLVVENIAPPRGDLLGSAVERGSLPVLVIFFTAAGASIQVDALESIGVLAIAVSVARMGLMRLGSGFGARLAGVPPPVDRSVWMGLVSQAGVTLGLSFIVAQEYPGWGERLQTFVLALVALHQLIGPVLFRVALERVGEVGAAREQGAVADLAAPAGEQSPA